MKCECGNNRFFASRMVRQEIITNEYGDFENSAHENIAEDLYAEDENLLALISAPNATKNMKIWYKAYKPKS